MTRLADMRTDWQAELERMNSESRAELRQDFATLQADLRKEVQSWVYLRKSSPRSPPPRVTPRTAVLMPSPRSPRATATGVLPLQPRCQSLMTSPRDSQSRHCVQPQQATATEIAAPAGSSSSADVAEAEGDVDGAMGSFPLARSPRESAPRKNMGRCVAPDAARESVGTPLYSSDANRPPPIAKIVGHRLCSDGKAIPTVRI